MANFMKLSLLFILLHLMSWKVVKTHQIKVELNEHVQQPPLWCVARNDIEDHELLDGMEYVCGVGGVDCGPIQPGGPCYTDDLITLVSYPYNEFCLNRGMTEAVCNFNNTAALTQLDPSFGKCIFASR